MATTDSRTPVSEIGFQSGLPPIIDLAKYMGGTKVGTAAGETATTRGETGPLEALLTQVSDPNNLLALVQALFTQGAQQVPGLSTAYAGATGTRTDNNAMLSQSLAQLNQTLAQSIANAIVAQQQNVALPAASQIAKSNTTAAGTKNSTAVTKPGNLLTSAAGVGGGLLLGSAANKIGKKLFPAEDTVTIPPSVLEPSLPTPGIDVSPPLDFGNEAPVALDAGAAGGAAWDFENASLIGGVADVVPDFTPDLSGITDFTDFLGFADGGRVGGGKWKQKKIDTEGSYADGGEVLQGKKATPENTTVNPSLDVISKLLDLWQSSITTNYPEPSKKEGGKGGKKGFADGGEVRRNVPQTGATPAVVGNPAANLLALLQPQQPRRKAGGEVVAPDSTDAAAASPAGTPGGTTETGALGPGTMGAMGLSAASGFSNAGLAGAIASAIAAAAHSMAAHGIASALAGTDDLAAGEDLGLGSFGDVAGEGESASDAAAAEAGAASDLGSGDFGGGDAGGESGSGGDGGGDGGGWSEGGAVKGKKKGTDSVTLKAMPGEYILPVDVVDYIGKDELDALVASLHTPLKTGTHG